MVANDLNDGCAIVFEDDVALTPDFSVKVLEALNELEAVVGAGEWDVLMLGALGCVEPNGRYGANRLTAAISGGIRRTRRLSERIHVPQRPYGTHAYLISRRGAQKLLARVPKAVMPEANPFPKKDVFTGLAMYDS